MRAALPILLVLAIAPARAAASGPWTLAQLVERARANDLRVMEAEAELKVLRAKYDEARWAWFPKLESTLLVAGPTPEARNDGLGGPPQSQATRMYDLNFGAAGMMVGAEAQAFLPLYTFGKLTALEKAGAQGLVIGEGLRSRAKNEAEFQMAQAFFGYQLARQGEAGLKETLTRLEEAGATLQKLFQDDSPQVTRMDLFKVDFYRRQVEARLGQAQSGKGFALAAVRLVGGIPIAEALALEPADLEEPAFQLGSLDHYLESAYEHRPELKMVEAGLAARQSEVFIRERLFYPDIGLAGFARWRWTSSATRQLSPFAYDPYNDASVGVALVTRVTFDVPVKQAQLEQSRAELEKLTIQKELLRSAIRLEAEKVYGELSEALSRGQSQALAERSARRWATAAAAGFDLGTGDTRELVDSFSAYAASAAEKLRAWHDAEVARRQLRKVLGAPLVLPPAPPGQGPVRAQAAER